MAGLEGASSGAQSGGHVVLEVGDRQFPVERWALARYSRYFEAMFFGGTRERTAPRIRIQGLDPTAFQALLAFTQTGSLLLDRNNVTELLEAADFLQLDCAKRLCEAFLERELHVSNCLGFLAYAQCFSCAHLQAAALSVVLSHWAEVASGEEFMEAPAETLRVLLRSDDLFVSREEAAFEALLQWATADPAGREAVFLELAGLIRGPFLSLPFLERLVRRCKSPPGQDTSGRLLQKLDACLPASWRQAGLSPCVGRSHEVLFVLAGKHDQEQQELFQFQPKTEVWQTRAPLRRKNLTQYAVAAIGNFLFVTGGYFREEFSWCSVGWVLIYNSWDDNWLDGPAMKTARHSHCAVGVGFHLYVMGGSTEEGAVTPEVERLAPTDSSWESTSPLAHPVERAGAVSVGTRVYVICGLDENGDVCHAVQRLDVETDIWDVVSFSPLPRYDLCVVALNGAIYTVGGGAFRFDVDSGEWTRVEEECLARQFFTGCSAANGRIYLLGQRQGNAALPNMVLLDPYLEMCQEVDSKLPCPLPIHGTASVRRFDICA
ncbi:21 isoform X1 [Podarcis lilfordi]|uniref:21 isoform X1 n=1 Tax=Podarcis lilfordi TaxID=74358 RepID=A0AA35LM18_9SAUR|nr:21 isoform X1 [Podarcis lilfordi]